MKKYLIIFVFALASLVGCKKGFLDINENPNAPTEDAITPNLVLPRALHATATRHGAGYSVLARWGGQWTRGGDFGPNVQEETYEITTTFGDGTWAAIYDNANDYDFLEKKAGSLGQKFYQGIAKTMKVVCFHELVDLFGNVPYSKAFDLNNNILPGYDKATAIYKDLFVKLDEALALIDAAGIDPGLKDGPGKFGADIMFDADKVMWKKFINTLRLKLVLRLVNTTGIITPATELAKITTDGCLGAGQTAAVNPGYKVAFSSSNVSQQNPFWDAYKTQVNGNESTRFHRAQSFTIDALRSAPLDIRSEYYFSPRNIPAGGYAGSAYGTPVISLSSDNQSNVAGPGLAKSASQGQWLLTSVESLFLQAEAKLRYPATTTIAGTDATLFNAAVTESFQWLNVANASTASTAYLASGKNFAGVTLTDYAASTNKLTTLLHQKYFSLVGMANFEIYCDIRRTGLPVVPKSIATNVGTNKMPVRYLYPQTEYNVNTSNVLAEGSISAQTSKIFWAL
jgi:Starch-binding associating with outer membrane